ncbi:nuclear transport factor 2 family protein [Streptomyces sp. UNOB3_S3]|uniref:nuclear transport factor 2 family protein n=1 Tax=Streptomyces sp. UNOB3_S3 TaxID=2871682 RepID=UPI001E5BBCA8|nr:nuclear transport factor 2 family protein [Streptomyces sp. UNOB3_S3]MCC3777686.1 nuclear transport factor 2 family protein [Streptomyces sp. UNOB3_S3]
MSVPAPVPVPVSISPAELYRHGLRLLLAKDTPGWVGLWAEDGVMEFPFAPPGRPRRLDGRAAIADYMRPYPDHIDLHDFPEADLRIHPTADPRTIVAEMRGVGRLVRTGRPFDMTYIAVVTVEDGRFTSYRDYWNPLAVLEPGVDFAMSSSR